VSGEKNKYQGGVLADDGHVYAIPSNSEQILCIDTNNKRISLVDLTKDEKRVHRFWKRKERQSLGN